MLSLAAGSISKRATAARAIEFSCRIHRMLTAWPRRWFALAVFVLITIGTPGMVHAGQALRRGLWAFDHHNYGAAAAIFAPMAQRGDAQAQTYLGLLYAQGFGVPQNYTEAALWYRRAADQGNPAAQYLLALLYDKGQGVPEDVIEAEKWLILATAGSNKVATDDRARMRDAVRTKMTRGELAQARRRALVWMPRREN
jgi:uncharacterized protein